MKQLFLLVIFALPGSTLMAQPWMPGKTSGPIKFSDIVAAYPKHSGKDDNEDKDKDRDKNEKHAGRVEKEGADYLFDRWAWYWQQHLDPNGYIVPSSVTLTEWQHYMGNQNKK